MQLALTKRRWLRFGTFSALYFAQGVPIGLLTVAVPAWLAERSASLSDVALFSAVVSLPWAFKLVAGPFMDRFTFLAMGFRRPWVIFAQACLALSFVALALVGNLDGGSLVPLMAIGCIVNAFAAIQDVAVDGMAIDILPPEERGRANAFMGFGQTAGFSAFGPLSGMLLSLFGLAAAALTCAVVVAAIFLFVAFVRERPGERLMPWTRGEATERADVQSSTATIFSDLFRALVLPMSLLLILVEFVNRVRDGIAAALFPVFAVQELGLTTAQYTQFNGVIGFAAATIGMLLGPFIDRAGAQRFLLFSLIGSAVCHFIAGLAPMLWQDLFFIGSLAFVANVFGQLVFVSIIALFMSLCWTRVAATQFAVCMSLANLSRSFGSGAFSLVADELSYVEDFLVMGALLVAAAALVLRFNLAAHTERLQRLKG